MHREESYLEKLTDPFLAFGNQRQESFWLRKHYYTRRAILVNE